MATDIPPMMVIKILVVVVMLMILVVFVAPVLFPFTQLAQLPEGNITVGTSHPEYADFTEFFYDKGAFVYSDYALTSGEDGLEKYLDRPSLTWNEKTCSGCVCSADLTVDSCNCTTCGSCTDTCTPSDTSKACFMCSGCSGGSCGECTVCKDLTETELCKRLKGAIRESYVTGKSITIEDFGWGKTNVNDIISPIVGELGILTPDDCVNEALTIEVEEGVEEEICEFKMDDNLMVLWNSKSDLDAYIKNKVVLSYYACDATYLKTPYSTGARAFVDYYYFDIASSTVVPGTNPERFGKIKMSVGNISRNSDGSCGYALLICNQNSFAYDTDETSMKILDFFRSFESRNNMFEVVADADDDEQATAAMEHYRLFKTFRITLDRDYNYTEIADVIQTGMFDWAASSLSSGNTETSTFYPKDQYKIILGEGEECGDDYPIQVTPSNDRIEENMMDWDGQQHTICFYDSTNEAPDLYKNGYKKGDTLNLDVHFYFNETESSGWVEFDSVHDCSAEPLKDVFVEDYEQCNGIPGGFWLGIQWTYRCSCELKADWMPGPLRTWIKVYKDD